jgi:hypothetical protein
MGWTVDKNWISLEFNPKTLSSLLNTSRWEIDVKALNEP